MQPWYKIDIEDLESQMKSYKVKITKENNKWYDWYDVCREIWFEYNSFLRIKKVWRVWKKIMTKLLEAGFENTFLLDK